MKKFFRSQLIYFVTGLLFVTTALTASGADATQKGTGNAEAAPQPKYKIGDTIPDFTLKDQNGKDVSLRDYRGRKNVVLAFFVFAFTGG